jgi:hypothetical protein
MVLFGDYLPQARWPVVRLVSRAGRVARAASFATENCALVFAVAGLLVLSG